MTALRPSRFGRIGRIPAALILALLVAALIVACWPDNSATAAAPRLRTPTQQSDAAFYRDIIQRVHRGENYYPAAASDLRKDGYPLRPFVTFRLPTEAYAYAWLGEPVMVAVQALLALAVIIVWWNRFRLITPLWQRAAAIFLLAAGSVGLVEPVTGLFHESWAALLMALAIGIRSPGRAVGALIAGTIALCVRETVLPFVLMMVGLAVIERRWREAAGWVAGVALFALYLAWHATQVAAVVLPHDQMSNGWGGLLGVRFALRALAMVSAATVLPAALAAAMLVLSLFGWASVASQWALRVTLLLLGYGAMVALFARADTFYWALLASPLSLVGVAFAPTAIADLVAALDGRRDRVAQPAA